MRTFEREFFFSAPAMWRACIYAFVRVPRALARRSARGGAPPRALRDGLGLVFLLAARERAIDGRHGERLKKAAGRGFVGHVAACAPGLARAVDLLRDVLSHDRFCTPVRERGVHGARETGARRLDDKGLRHDVKNPLLTRSFRISQSAPASVFSSQFSRSRDITRPSLPAYLLAYLLTCSLT